jgi:hypothetical protein
MDKLNKTQALSMFPQMHTRQSIMIAAFTLNIFNCYHKHTQRTQSANRFVLKTCSSLLKEASQKKIFVNGTRRKKNTQKIFLDNSSR